MLIDASFHKGKIIQEAIEEHVFSLFLRFMDLSLIRKEIGSYKKGAIDSLFKDYLGLVLI
ncbi:hypothetical protein [Holospora undulata]|uniref:Uncharacterized protein n=1 Tax=Holospora undulata HU1 TaxID=1321371 RepID=A0A061JI73_9PROT|nr:hypothetical protein [Holospora undulata]ETZ05208.1 hypothetical protein K737_300355 [Holospora undulata HU1]